MHADDLLSLFVKQAETVGYSNSHYAVIGLRVGDEGLIMTLTCNKKSPVRSPAKSAWLFFSTTSKYCSDGKSALGVKSSTVWLPERAGTHAQRKHVASSVRRIWAYLHLGWDSGRHDPNFFCNLKDSSGSTIRWATQSLDRSSIGRQFWLQTDVLFWEQHCWDKARLASCSAPLIRLYPFCPLNY